MCGLTTKKNSPQSETALLSLSFDLKYQHLVMTFDHKMHIASIALEELAMLCHANRSLVDRCEDFVSSLQSSLKSSQSLQLAWIKAKYNLRIKLIAYASSVDPLTSYLDTRKRKMADTLHHLREQNKKLSKMLREHPRATERGLSQSNLLALDVFKALQRHSIDSAILSQCQNSNNITSIPSSRKRKVSFDENGPQIIGNADEEVDRAPVLVTRPGKMEMLIIRGSRILPIV